MGYILKNNGLTIYKTIIDAADIKNMGSLPILLNGPTPQDLNGLVFLPLSATLRQINNTQGYNFPAQAHPTIQDSGNYFFIWEELLTDQLPDIYVYQALYIQGEHQITTIKLTSNYYALKQGNQFMLTTQNGADSNTGNGQVIVTIAGYLTTV